jgi:hypothetical protein
MFRLVKKATIERVAGHFDVGLADDARTIVLKQLDWKADRDGIPPIALSHREARHLASLLIMNAEAAEEAGEGLKTGWIRW